MLRELSEVLLDMHEALMPQGEWAQQMVQLQAIDLVLPLDLQVTLADGGVQLLGELPRTLSEGNWRVDASRLSLRLEKVAA